MRGKNRDHLFIVKIPAIMPKRRSQSYVLRSLRGEERLSPEHAFWPLTQRRKITVKTCLYDIEQDTGKLLKAKLQAYFRKNEVSSGVYCDIMKIVDDHLDGAV